MTPVVVFNSIGSPFLRTLVATFVPIIQGIPYSREIIAAWEIMPPSSVISAFAFLLRTIDSGRIISVTRIYPFLNSFIC